RVEEAYFEFDLALDGNTVIDSATLTSASLIKGAQGSCNDGVITIFVYAADGTVDGLDHGTLGFEDPTTAALTTVVFNALGGGQSTIIPDDIPAIDITAEVQAIVDAGFSFVGIGASAPSNVLYCSPNTFFGSVSVDVESSPGGSGCAGDANDDQLVNVADFIAVLLNFGATGPGVAGDANNDELVDVADFIAVLLNFGACNP
ncbi:MAG: hypothetical protein AAGB34_11550, partial [Planctomycetota bacterium]